MESQFTVQSEKSSDSDSYRILLDGDIIEKEGVIELTAKRTQKEKILPLR